MEAEDNSQRFILPGAAMPRLFLKVKDMVRFTRKIRQQGDCWRWTGHRDRKGYGQIWHEGMVRWAHRFSYAAFIGEIPPAKTIDHTCHNPWCVNPAHLRVLTREENTAEGNRRRAETDPEEPQAVELGEDTDMPTPF